MPLALTDAQLAKVNRAAELMAPNARDSFLQNVAALLDNASHRDDGAVLDAVMTVLSWRGVAVGKAFFASGAPPPRRRPAQSREAQRGALAAGASRHRV